MSGVREEDEAEVEGRRKAPENSRGDSYTIDNGYREGGPVPGERREDTVQGTRG